MHLYSIFKDTLELALYRCRPTSLLTPTNELKMGNSPTTTVANGYHEDILARVTVNQRLLDRQKLKVSGGVDALQLGVGGSSTEESKYQHVQQLQGFTKIRSGHHLPFSISGNEDGKVWVTITCKDQVIAENYPLRNGCNAIVDTKGCLKRAEIGEVWIDDNGYGHEIGSCGQKRMTPAEKWEFRAELL